MPESIPTRTADAFRLDENVEALTWNERDGYHACLRWDGQRDTDLIGPYPRRSVAIAAIKAAFLMAVGADAAPEASMPFDIWLAGVKRILRDNFALSPSAVPARHWRLDFDAHRSPRAAISRAIAAWQSMADPQAR